MSDLNSINTFDVFDTLVARRCVQPLHIFSIMEKKLKLTGLATARRLAEQRVVHRKHNLDDIYAELQSVLSLSDANTDLIKRTEIETELENIIPIQENISKVSDGDILISDMYLQEQYIRALLSRAGLNKEVGLIVTNHGKHHGYIWPEILSRFSIKTHTGDNTHADIFQASQAGIATALTNSHQITPLEKIFFDITFPAFGELCREARLSTWSNVGHERSLQINQINFNFPMLFFSSIILYRLAKKLGKKHILFSSRDCHLWIKLFEAMFPGEFVCSYYYTSRYAKVFGQEDYIAYTKTLLRDDAIIVDLCGSGWSLEKLCENLGIKSLDAFFIHKLPKDRAHMGMETHGLCNFHSILEEGIDTYKSYFLEIANFTDHGMVKDVKMVNAVACPVFFEDKRPETELRYVATQKQAFDACLAKMQHYDLHAVLQADMAICTKLVTIFYGLLSKNTFMLDLYGKNFFQETEAVEKIISNTATNRYFKFQPDTSASPSSADINGTYAIQIAPVDYTYIPKAPPYGLAASIADKSTIEFSIIVPMHNTSLLHAQRMLASVQHQWFPHWELILVNNGSTDPQTLSFLGGLNDPKVKVVTLTGCGLSEALNAGIAQTRGNYSLFLGQADELTHDCLYELADCILHTSADYIYADEDTLTQTGDYTEPQFKPDWSPDTCMSLMYTGHTCCVRKTFLETLGGFHPAFDGAQDWDLVLRMSENTTQIAHVSKVLYHARQHAPAASATVQSRADIVAAGLRAREAALQRRGLTARLEPVQSAPDYHRVAYAVQGSPLVSVIIPSKNNGKILLQCIQSFAAKNQWDNTEFVILDNGSDQPETLSILDDLRARKDVRMIRHAAPFNYSELNNIGIRASGGDILLFLNDDTELLAPDALARMIGYAQLPHVGAVGAKLLYRGGEYMQHTGLINLPSGPEHAFLRQPDTIHGYGMRNVLEYDWSSVTGACMMIERKKCDLIGGFNESFPVAYNDIEFCYRLLAQQFYNVICPSARFLHYESISRGSDFATAERRNRLQHDWQRLYAHHPSMFMSDPFYNPNLNQQSRDFTLAM
ncbi:glycosyltransferase [Acetobacter okinawensis]|uniref:glycosyltransferase n=1 Tax=Acetobacter okinawensis TaxID=1076594 RepID=UPI0020A226FE|nr:glycosyltransferase [Acetobacter okinawensis]MCP1212339.1 glycosyltransferase [Acetobacter okinawensis]